LIRKREEIPKKEITFARYAENWWIWDQCEYIRKKRAKHQQISRGYADHQRRYLNNYTLPEFGNTYLSRITPHDIEKWLLKMQDKGLSDSAVYTAFSGLRVMLQVAVRRGFLYRNPASSDNIDTPSRLTTDEKGIFTTNVIHFTANLVAASTGCRVAEIQALSGLSRKFGDVLLC